MPRPWNDMVVITKSGERRLKGLYLSILLTGCAVTGITLAFALSDRVWLIRGLTIGGLLIADGMITYYGMVRRAR